MLEARKRTALDGKIWWCVFNTKTMKYCSEFGKYKLKKDCQYTINKLYELADYVKQGDVQNEKG